MTTFLATLDGSPTSETILPPLALLARELHATVTLLTVAEPPRSDVSSGGTEQADAEQMNRVELWAGSGQFGAPAVSPWPGQQGSTHEFHGQELDRLRDSAQGYLDDKASALRSGGLEVTTVVLMDDKPAEAITRFAAEHKIDVIAMSTHGRSGLGALVHGSVTSEVIKAGVVPVLALRPAS